MLELLNGSENPARKPTGSAHGARIARLTMKPTTSPDPAATSITALIVVLTPDCSIHRPSADPRSFVAYQITGLSTAGDPQQYCLCDTGCCAPDAAAIVQVDATAATHTISWSGRQWSGPSDTDNPEDEFFAPGTYDVEVTFDGQEQGSVTAKLPIEILR